MTVRLTSFYYMSRVKAVYIIQDSRLMIQIFPVRVAHLDRRVAWVEKRDRSPAITFSVPSMSF